MQAYANSFVLAGPVLLGVTNTSDFQYFEFIGMFAWMASWYLENTGDMQMSAFVKAAKVNGDIRTAVLGHSPYDTEEYWLWTKTRHPNYFFEWMCWNSFILMGIPSLVTLAVDWTVWDLCGTATFTMWCLLFFFLSRTFYDCLLYWTGAEPAEQRSVRRRPTFATYQQKVRVFFPFEMPPLPCPFGCWPDHHRTPGWPLKQAPGDVEVPEVPDGESDTVSLPAAASV